MNRAGERTGEAGVSLIEAILAVFILGSAIVALIGGLGTSLIASDAQRKNVTADAVVRSWAEKLQAAPWVSCATKATSAYSAATLGVTAPPKYAAPTIASIDYWQGNSPATYGASCVSGGPTDTAQRITLVELSSDGRGGQRLQIVKRKP